MLASHSADDAAPSPNPFIFCLGLDSFRWWVFRCGCESFLRHSSASKCDLSGCFGCFHRFVFRPASHNTAIWVQPGLMMLDPMSFPPSSLSSFLVRFLLFYDTRIDSPLFWRLVEPAFSSPDARHSSFYSSSRHSCCYKPEILEKATNRSRSFGGTRLNDFLPFLI